MQWLRHMLYCNGKIRQQRIIFTNAGKNSNIVLDLLRLIYIDKESVYKYNILCNCSILIINNMYWQYANITNLQMTKYNLITKDKTLKVTKEECPGRRKESLETLFSLFTKFVLY